MEPQLWWDSLLIDSTNISHVLFSFKEKIARRKPFLKEDIPLGKHSGSSVCINVKMGILPLWSITEIDLYIFPPLWQHFLKSCTTKQKPHDQPPSETHKQKKDRNKYMLLLSGHFLLFWPIQRWCMELNTMGSTLRLLTFCRLVSHVDSFWSGRRSASPSCLTYIFATLSAPFLETQFLSFKFLFLLLVL